MIGYNKGVMKGKTMPDITMCASNDCPRKLKCYRHEAKPGRWQSMAGFYNPDERCDFFIPIDESRDHGTRDHKKSNK
jgi:hypothetical protein